MAHIGIPELVCRQKIRNSSLRDGHILFSQETDEAEALLPFQPPPPPFYQVQDSVHGKVKPKIKELK